MITIAYKLDIFILTFISDTTLVKFKLSKYFHLLSKNRCYKMNVMHIKLIIKVWIWKHSF